MLGLGARPAAPRPGQPMNTLHGAARFLLPVQQVEFQLTGILEQLARDPWPVANDKRALRCTGVAINVAVSLLEVWCLSRSPRTTVLYPIHRARSRTLARGSSSLLVGLAPKDPAWSLAMS